MNHNNPPPPPVPAHRQSPQATAARQVAWQALLKEVSELHARIEYLSLMLKLGVRR